MQSKAAAKIIMSYPLGWSYNTHKHTYHSLLRSLSLLFCAQEQKARLCSQEPKPNHVFVFGSGSQFGTFLDQQGEKSMNCFFFFLFPEKSACQTVAAEGYTLLVHFGFAVGNLFFFFTHHVRVNHIYYILSSLEICLPPNW